MTDQAETGGVSSPSGLWGFLRHEPLVHFLALAALLFIANAIFAGDDREVIAVDTATQEYLLQERRDLLLRELTEQETQDVIDSFVEEEILTREARKRGFDSNSRIRTLLIQNMRFFLSQDLPAPSDEDLRRHYEENPERFETAPSITYEHVFFANPADVPKETLARLRDGADHTQMGDRDNLSARPRLVQITQPTISTTFGPEIAPQVLAIEDDDWHGPFESGQGAHFLRAAEWHEALRPAYEAIENWVENDWQLYQSRRQVDLALAEMRNDYIVDIQAADGASD